MQVTNYIIPLLVIPVLLNKIGLEKYGVISLALGIANLLVGLGDYGLNLTGTREISRSPKNLQKIRRIAENTISTRVFLSIIGFVFLLILSELITDWRINRSVILSSYTIVIGRLLLPVWYFQGVQRMYWITIINLGARLLYLFGLLLFVHDESDTFLVNLLNGFSWILASGIAIAIMICQVGRIKLILDFEKIRTNLKQNFSIFLANSTSTTYRNGSIIIAGFLLGPSILGLFSVLDRLVAIIANTASVAFRSLFPKSSEISKNGVQFLKIKMLKVLKIGALPVTIFSFALLLLGPKLLPLLSEELNNEYLDRYIAIIAVLPLLLLLNIPLSLSLVSMKMDRLYLVYQLSGLFSLLLISTILAFQYSITGLLYGFLSIEIMMILSGILILRKKKI